MNESKPTDKELKQEWIDVWKIIAQPLPVLLIVLTVIFGYGTYQSNENTQLLGILTIITSIISGVAGAAISYKWQKLNEGREIYTRAKGAVRNLRLLLKAINTHQYRIQCNYQKIISPQADKGEITPAQMAFEGAIADSISLQEQTMNSIEDWTDIVPEANIRTQIGVITDLNKHLEKTKEELSEMAHKLEEQELKKEEREEIESQIKELRLEKINLETTIEKKKQSYLNFSAGYNDFRTISDASLLNQEEFESRIWKARHNIFGLSDKEYPPA